MPGQIITVPTETFGAKLRRLAEGAANNNALTRAPWIVPPAWAPSTVYAPGAFVSNAGSWFVCTTGGTSAASGGPTTITNGNANSDGTAAWSFYGSAIMSASDPLAPTVTSSATDPRTTYTNSYAPAIKPQFFRTYGGYASTLRTNHWSILTFNQAAASPISRGASAAFMTDAPEFAFFVPSNALGVRLLIDGRYYSMAPFDFSGTDTWVTVKFSTYGGRRMRRIEIEGNKALSYFGIVAVSANDQVVAPSVLDDVRAVFISDSLYAGSGYGPWMAGGTVPRRVSKLLGWSDPWNFSTGGTGYIATNAGASYTYGQRITEALTVNPDVWVFMGSTNDIGQSSTAITAAALASYQAIRNGGSKAPIIVLGVWSKNDAGVSATEAAIQAAVTAFADPLGKTFFIPIYADPVLPWVTGAWNNGSLSTSINATMMIAGDGTHPADVGTAYLSERTAAAIQANVLKNLA